VPRKKHQSDPSQPTADTPPRIIGGDMRGRKLIYTGDPRTRPMKERVREAVFNLVSLGVRGKHAIDLFAGTGALGLEALSRGAATATLVERHFPTADIIKQNATALGVEDRCTILPANTLLFPKRWPPFPAVPWVVFCSPPYDFYIDYAADILALIGGLMERAAPESIFCVEADERFDYGQLPHAEAWDVRTYPPAIVGIWRKPVQSTA
jgi:16S rRNA (guanine(966)-N(2))-methyltransferase RsmD